MRQSVAIVAHQLTQLNQLISSNSSILLNHEGVHTIRAAVVVVEGPPQPEEAFALRLPRDESRFRRPDPRTMEPAHSQQGLR